MFKESINDVLIKELKELDLNKDALLTELKFWETHSESSEIEILSTEISEEFYAEKELNSLKILTERTDFGRNEMERLETRIPLLIEQSVWRYRALESVSEKSQEFAEGLFEGIRGKYLNPELPNVDPKFLLKELTKIETSAV